MNSRNIPESGTFGCVYVAVGHNAQSLLTVPVCSLMPNLNNTSNGDTASVSPHFTYFQQMRFDWKSFLSLFFFFLASLTIFPHHYDKSGKGERGRDAASLGKHCPFFFFSIFVFVYVISCKCAFLLIAIFAGAACILLFDPSLWLIMVGL